jgi:DNA-binding PadR family transcriptional regulator
MARDAARPEALTPATLHVLLALGRGPLHGYAIMRQVEVDSGTVMGPGTVYGTLTRLERAGWVEDAGEDGSDSRRGRLFALTRSGRKALEQEIARIHRLAELARELRIVPGEGR